MRPTASSCSLPKDTQGHADVQHDIGVACHVFWPPGVARQRVAVLTSDQAIIGSAHMSEAPAGGNRGFSFDLVRRSGEIDGSTTPTPLGPGGCI